MIADRPDLFQRGECILVSIEIECDGHNCEADKLIHTLQGIGTGFWTPKTAPKDWRFPDSIRCSAGHSLRFDESRKLHVVTQAELPF